MGSCERHPFRPSVANCAGCGLPLCFKCVEAEEEGRAYCYDCALDQQLNEFKERKKIDREHQDELEEKKNKGSRALRIAAVILAVIVLAEAGFILYSRLAYSAPADEVTPEEEEMWETDECTLAMQDIREALDLYFADHRSYPASLAELEGNYLESTIVCPKTGAGYGYRDLSTGYILYCPNPQVHGVNKIEASESKMPYYEEKTSDRSE